MRWIAFRAGHWPLATRCLRPDRTGHRALATVLLLLPTTSSAPDPIVVDLRSPHQVEQFAAARGWTLDRPEIQLDIMQRIAAESAAAGIDSGIVPELLAIAWRESRFLHVVSPPNYDGSRDWGPLQVNDRWTPEVAGQTTRETIRLGIRIFAGFLERCAGSIPCAHRAYRTGKVER